MATPLVAEPFAHVTRTRLPLASDATMALDLYLHRRDGRTRRTGAMIGRLDEAGLLAPSAAGR